jgi:hypothetical protein
MKWSVFSLRDLCGLVLVCCFVLAGYRLGERHGREAVLDEALEACVTPELRYFDTRLARWAAKEESWLELRKKIVVQQTPVSRSLFLAARRAEESEL